MKDSMKNVRGEKLNHPHFVTLQHDLLEILLVQDGYGTILRIEGEGGATI